MQIEVNGQTREVAEGTTIFQLLAELQLDVRYVAVECNRELVPRVQHATTTLADGDQLEVVTLVGGG